MSPQRVQLRRAKGWRMPENTVSVARPGKWGNPYRVVKDGHEWGVKPPGYANIEPATASIRKENAALHAIAYFRVYIGGDPDFTAHLRSELAGKDLACWCPLNQPCHADVLLEIANGGPR